MKKKLLFGTIIGLLALALVLLSIPRVSSQQTVSADRLKDLPALSLAYQQACVKYPDLVPGAEIELVEVVSLWGSCEYYILPCYQAVMRAAPQNGQADWYTALYVVTGCSRESSLTAKLCNLEIQNVYLEVQASETTFLSTRVSIEPGERAYDMGEGASVKLEETFACANAPVLQVHFLAGTAMGAQVENEQASGTYVWNFDLYCCGKPIRSYRDAALTQDYLVNAV